MGFFRKPKPGPEHQDPPVQHQDPPIVTPGEQSVEAYCGVVLPPATPAVKPYDRSQDARYFLAAGEPLPTHHIKRDPIPCPECRRIRTDNYGQACVVTSSGDKTAFFRCKCCNHRWELPIKHA